MLKKMIAWLIVIALFGLASCNSPVYKQTEGNVAVAKIKTLHARRKFDNQGNRSPSLVVKQGPYVDTTPISLEREPSWLHNLIVLRGDSLPFSYYSRTIATGAGAHILTKFQQGLDPTVAVTLNYSGSVKGALDLLASKTNFVYKIRNNRIYWQAFVTKTFDVAFMPGGTDYFMGSAKGGSDANSITGGSNNASAANYTTSDASDSEYSNLKGTLSLWKDLRVTLEQLRSPEGKFVVSESTSSITVRDKPSNVELVEQFIRNLNNNLSKQVLVKVQVLEVALESDFLFGIDWGIIARAFNKSPFVINANYGTPITISNSLLPSTNTTGKTGTAYEGALPPGLPPIPNPGSPLPSYTILVNALKQQGRTSVVSEPRVICLNNQVSVVRVVQSRGYVASIQNTSLAGSTSSGTNNNNNLGTVTSQVTPGNVVTGLTLYILPKVLKSNIYLQINADISTLENLATFPSTASTSNVTQIQLPQVAIKHFNQRSMIKSGDTLILSGFRQVGNAANTQQFMATQALGGRGSQQQSRETIILITPIVLHGTA